MSSNKKIINTEYFIMLKDDRDAYKQWQVGDVFKFNSDYMVIKEGPCFFRIAPGIYICDRTGVILEAPWYWDPPLDEGTDYEIFPEKLIPFLKKSKSKKCNPWKIICKGYEDCIDCNKENCKYRE